MFRRSSATAILPGSGRGGPLGRPAPLFRAVLVGALGCLVSGAPLVLAGPAAGPPGLPAPVAAALANEALPVLVRIGPEAAGEAVTFPVALAPGEAPRGARTTVATVDGRSEGLAARVLEHHPDGSAARLGVRMTGFGSGETLLLVFPLRLADPAELTAREGTPEAPVRTPPGVTVFGGEVAKLVEKALWKNELADAGSSRPSWWDEAEARFPVGSDPDDLDGRIEFIQVAYAEKGRPRRAIRLFQEITAGVDAEQGSLADVSPSRVRSWLTACHEIAHLYAGALQDHRRALGWALRCADAPLDDPAEERQNRIAAALSAVRALEGLGHHDIALVLDRLLARELLLDPDPYGTLLLPRIFLRIGDAELGVGGRGAEDAAKSAYRAAVASSERLPGDVPSNYLAPGSVARAALRRLEARGLELSRVPDGTYAGEAFGYNTPVEVRLSFEAGRCTAFHVTELGDKRPLDAYRVLPDRILETQSLEVDAVTGATVTSRAIVSAATDAVFTAGQGRRTAQRRGDDEGAPVDD